MNYNSIRKILSAGTTNMIVVRNNSKQDDGTDTITCPSWCTYNGSAISTIYVNGNSWIGFGSATEHLRVNRRDGAMWSLYTEEGTLYDYYKFLKIRFRGYSAYNTTSSSYAIVYDVILWDTGDISLHMVTIPTSKNNGTYSLTAGSIYTYTVNTSNPDITFTKTNTGFSVSNTIINLENPPEKRFLIRSGSTYYTIINNALAEIPNTYISSDRFLAYGIKTIPRISLIQNLQNPEILYWTDKESGTISNLVISGTPPMPQLLYYESQSIPDGSYINAMEASCSDDVLLNITFNGGTTWYYHNGEIWQEALTTSNGMNSVALKNITPAAWSEICTNSTAYQVRCILPSVESYVNILRVGYN